MKSALLSDDDGLRTFVIVCETADEAMQALASFATEQRLAGSHFTGVGAFERATVAYFDWPTRRYQPLSIGEQVEVLSIAGDITLDKDQRTVHAHVVLGKREERLTAAISSTVTCGRRSKSCVESPAHLQRGFDPSSGLALIDPDLTRG